MARYNIEHNGLWACFSTMSDSFVTEFMDKITYEEWRIKQYGLSDYQPAEQCNVMTIEEAVFHIRLNRTHDEALDCLLDSGLVDSECDKILYDMETKYHVPIPTKNGKYECPNCHKEITREDRSCDGDTCCLDFVWR